MEGRFVQLGAPLSLPDGRKVVFERKSKKRARRAGSTAKHESRHAVAAEANGTRVISATIIPGPGYLGLTTLSRPDAVAGAAPHAHGDSGTGHDMNIVERLGWSARAACSAAERILANREEQVEEVAAALQENGSLGGSAIRRIMAQTGNGEEILMRIISPQGHTEVRVLQKKPTHGDFIHVSELPQEIPTPANTNRPKAKVS